MVHTSDMKMAGTDANIFLQAYGKTKDGEYLKTDEVELDNKGDNFEQGKKDTFKRQLADIGKPYKIRIWHDDRKPFSGWHLDRVEMTNMTTKVILNKQSQSYTTLTISRATLSFSW